MKTTLQARGFGKSKLIIGPQTPHNRTQIDSDAEGNGVERIVDAAGVAHLQHEHPGGTDRAPDREPVVAHQVGGSDRDVCGLKYALVIVVSFAVAGLRRARLSRRADGCARQLAHDCLLAGRFNRVDGGTSLQETRETIPNSSFDVSHKAERRVWPDKERSIGDRIRQADVTEWRQPAEGSVKVICPVDRWAAGAESPVLIAGGRGAGNHRGIVQRRIRKCESKFRVHVADAVVRYGACGACNRLRRADKKDRQTAIDREVLVEAVADGRIQPKDIRQRIRTAEEAFVENQSAGVVRGRKSRCEQDKSAEPSQSPCTQHGLVLKQFLCHL